MKKVPALLNNSILNKVLLLCLGLLIFAACKDDKDTFDPGAQKTLDQNKIQEYLTSKNLTATKTASGLNYIITDPGSGAELKMGDVVSVHYRGYFLDGSSFDSSFPSGVPYTLRLGESPGPIPGFEEGLLLLKPGAKATLLIPSDLAYGPSGQGSIPPNTVLLFDIELVNQQTSPAIGARIIQEYFSAKNITNATLTDSGAYIVSTTPGTGAQARLNDEVAVHYTGKFLSGTEFERSISSSPKILKLGAGTMPKGFEDALRKMKVGEKATIIVPSHLGYGALGSSANPPDIRRSRPIPPYSELVYEGVELVAIK